MSEPEKMTGKQTMVVPEQDEEENERKKDYLKVRGMNTLTTVINPINLRNSGIIQDSTSQTLFG